MQSSAVHLKKSMLRLYYLIKKAHIQALLPKMRAIGDPFVTQEFKAHIHNTDPKFLKGFIENWIEYYQMLANSTSAEDLAKGMSEDKLELLSEEQKETMQKIKSTIK